MLKGQAKKDYQREYMRERRRNKKIVSFVDGVFESIETRRKRQDVRPSQLDLVQPELMKYAIARIYDIDDGGNEIPHNNSDTVWVIKWPEIDADGNPVYEG